ncbi:hypothetical protein ONS95_007184 [Cadophora gregata]|uniref:uncharacterized protein n=1 Tax=Cadophora gregata TaxID=51156 RepID=UPI0026DD4DF1|nr:uncharacterized protein ONS95_007184 [Cadophora gregata]KAK0100734.1 hypothetical protein ONS95_007184 [Cadophora gregata]
MHFTKVIAALVLLVTLSPVAHGRAVTRKDLEDHSFFEERSVSGKPSYEDRLTIRAAPRVRPGNNSPGSQGGNGAPSQGPNQAGAGQGVGQGSDQNFQEPAPESQPPPVVETTPTKSPSDTDTTTPPPAEKASDSTNPLDEDSDLCVRKRCLSRIDRPLDYGVAQSNGNRVLSEARNFIDADLPKRPVPDTVNGYVFQRDGEDTSAIPGSPAVVRLDHENIFADPTSPDLNLDTNSQVADIGWRSVIVPLQKNEAPNTDVNRAKIDTRQGVMIATTRDKSADGNIPGAEGSGNLDNVVPSHELSWQLWQKQVSADGGDVSSLRVLVAESVQGRGTKDTITMAIASTGQTVDMGIQGTKAVFTPDASNPAMMQAFTALCGTDNIRPFGQMLAQNHRDLGNKVIQKISVYGNSTGRDGICKPHTQLPEGSQGLNYMVLVRLRRERRKRA